MAKDKQPHRWKLEASKEARRAVSELPSDKDRKAVFDSLEELLQAENPYSVQGVKKLQEEKFEQMRRQDKGHWRVFFYIESETVVVGNFEYKGTLYVWRIKHRDNKTYR